MVLIVVTDTNSPIAYLLYLFDDRVLHRSMVPPSLDLAGKLTHLSVILTIMVAVTSFVCQTVHEWNPKIEGNEDQWWWGAIDHACFAVFLSDWLLRLWGSIACGEAAGFFSSTMNWIDVCSIVPFYMEAVGADVLDARLLRTLRLARVTALLKSARFGSIGDVVLIIIESSLAPMLIPVFFMSLSSIVLAALMYHAEYCQTADNIKVCQTDKIEVLDQFFYSIPQAIWWAFVTFTTVGYGDLFPFTNAGRLLNSFAMALGVFFTSMPVAIVGNAFEKTWSALQQNAAIVEMAHQVEMGNRKVDFNAVNKQRLTMEALMYKVRKDLKNWAKKRPEIEQDQYSEVLHKLEEFESNLADQWKMYGGTENQVQLDLAAEKEYEEFVAVHDTFANPLQRKSTEAPIDPEAGDFPSPRDEMET